MARGHASGRDLALHAAAGLRDEGCEQFAGVALAHRGVLAQADAAPAFRPARPELADRERRDRRLLLGGLDLVAAAHGVDRVEVHRKGRIDRVEGLVGVLDARDAQVGRVVAPVDDDAGERRLADRIEQRRREQRQLLRNQERIAAAAHVQHAFVVQVEAGLEAVVLAQDLQRHPGGHDLGDGGRDEGLVGVLRHQLVSLGVHHQHQPRRGQRRDLLLGAGQGLVGAGGGGQGRAGKYGIAPGAVSNRGELYLTCSGPNPKKSRPA